MEGLICGWAYLWREICFSKSIGLALYLGTKFTVFAFFYFVFEGKFPITSPRGVGGGGGGLYLERRFNEGFLRYEFGGLIFGGA